MRLCLGDEVGIQDACSRRQVSEEEKAVVVVPGKARGLGPDVGRSTC